MNLKIKTNARNRVVHLSLETVDFTPEEEAVLRQVGEPVINFEENYGKHTVKFEKRIRTGFKVAVKFDGNLDEDMHETNCHISDFKTELQERLSLAMGEAIAEHCKEIEDKEETEELVPIVPL